MDRTATRRRFLAGGAVAALTSLAGCSGATPFVGKRTESDRTLSLDGVSTLSVHANVGDVRVVGEDRDDAVVHLVKKASSVTADLSGLTLAVEPDGDHLRLRTQYEGPTPFFGGTPTMDLSLRVPRSLAVDRVRTTVGDVTARDVAGDLVAEATTGDVRLRGVRGTVTAEASTGDVVVDGADAVGDVSTSTGDIDLTVAAIDGPTRFSASTGDVTAALSPDIDASLAARTNTGDVVVQGLPVADATRDDKSVSGTLGDGGPDLTVETNTGDVRLSAYEADT